MAVITSSSLIKLGDMLMSWRTGLIRGSTKGIYTCQYPELPLCRIDIAASYLNTTSFKTHVPLSRLLALVIKWCSVKDVFHRAYSTTFSRIVYLKWCFQRTLMNDLYSFLGVSMSYFSGGRFQMNGIQLDPLCLPLLNILIMLLISFVTSRWDTPSVTLKYLSKWK